MSLQSISSRRNSELSNQSICIKRHPQLAGASWQRKHVLEFHRQCILAAFAVVGHVDGENVFLPSGQFGGVIPANAVDFHRMNTAQRTDEPFFAELAVIQLHKVHHAAQDRCTERIGLAIPRSHDQPQGFAVDFFAHLVIQLESGAHTADAVIAQLQAVIVESGRG